MREKSKTSLPLTMVVTIDGPSASGKSTIARLLAKKLHFEHLDTGAIYRAIALWCYEQGFTTEDAREKFIPRLHEIDYVVDSNQGRVIHQLNGRVINNEIRQPHISQLASKLAVIQEVRNFATEIQRKIAEGKNVVVEGRDAGTVVFPRAPVKLFLTAKREERAKRRMEELLKKYPESTKTLSIEETMQELEERDERDRKRENSPMKKAVDAVTVDTTGLTIDQVIKAVVKVVKKRRPKRPGPISRWLMGERRAHTTFLYKLTWVFTRCIYRLFYRFKVYGLENYPIDDECATIVAPNHVSFLDPPAIGIACPVELHALAIDYLFKAPLLGWLLPKINVHPVSSSVTDAKVMRSVVSLLKEGRHVLIFPEGSRSADNELLPFKRGVGVLAALTNCSITPAYIDGAYEAWRRGRIFPKPWGKISVVFGKPLYFKDYEEKASSKKEAEKMILSDLREKILELKQNFHRT